MVSLNFFTEHLELMIIQVYDRDSQPKSVKYVFLYMYGWFEHILLIRWYKQKVQTLNALSLMRRLYIIHVWWL